MGVNVLFDSLSAQVQVQNETQNRLTTWTQALESTGYTVNYSDYTRPLTGQLMTQVDQNTVPLNQVLIITTRQRANAPNCPPAIPPCVSFAYESSDLGGIQSWIRDEGGGLLLFVNHSAGAPVTQQNPPLWPIYDIQLAAALGITTVFATIGLTDPRFPPPGVPIPMPPNPEAPPAIIDGVKAVEAWDSGGIVPVMPAMSKSSGGTVLVPLPAGSTDASGLGYNTADLAFAVLYTLGKGKIIVIGHSGIAGNEGTSYPSPGQIESGDNLNFLMNCVAYLAGSAS